MLKVLSVSIILLLIQFFLQASPKALVTFLAHDENDTETQDMVISDSDETILSASLIEDDKIVTDTSDVGQNVEGNENSLNSTDELFDEVLTEDNYSSIEDNEEARAHVDMDINDFEDLKDQIIILLERLRYQAVIDLVGNEELVKTEKLLIDINDKILEPTENNLKSLRSQIVKSNLELDDEFRTLVEATFENYEKFLNTSRARLDEVEELEEIWENEEAEYIENIAEENDDVHVDNYENEAIKDYTESDADNSYNQFKSRNIYDKHIDAHEDETKMLNSDLSEAADTLISFSSMHPYLTPGLTMLVFLLMCSAVAYKLTRKTRRARRLVSQV